MNLKTTILLTVPNERNLAANVYFGKHIIDKT